MRIQRRDKMFADGARSRFRLPGKKNRCSKLIVDGEVISSPQSLMEVWAQYFSNLAKSKVDESPGLQELQQTVNALAMQSLGIEDHLLDASFTAEKVGFAIRKLKRRKAPGPDKLMAEHLIEGDDVVTTWLTGILNAVIDLESVPDSLKRGVVVPVYKGSGKDPLQVESYRGVTLSSVVAKVLEFLVLERLQMVFLEASIPHPNQSAYRKRVSCADSIFATQEVIGRYLRSGSQVFMCLYDLSSCAYMICKKRLIRLSTR